MREEYGSQQSFGHRVSPKLEVYRISQLSRWISSLPCSIWPDFLFVQIFMQMAAAYCPSLRGKKINHAPCTGIIHTIMWISLKPGASIRNGDWKLIKFYDYEKVELYNLKNDPSESKDLSGQNPKIAKDLESKLVAWQKSMKAKLPRPNPDYKNYP